MSRESPPHLAVFWCNLACTCDWTRQKKKKKKKRRTTTFGSGCNVTSIRRLIRNAQQDDGCVDEESAPEKEIHIFCFPVNTNCIISFVFSLSSAPAIPHPLPPPPSLRGDQTSAVTCQSSPDRQWPCSALLGTIWIDLAFFKLLPLLVLSPAIGL